MDFIHTMEFMNRRFFYGKNMNNAETYIYKTGSDFGYDGQKSGLADAASIQQHLATVETSFVETLSRITHGAGWEVKAGKSVFTGIGVCGFAVSALYHGLREIVSPLVQLHELQVNIYYNRENPHGAGGFYRESFGNHCILAIGKKLGGTDLYVDPTYGQLSPDKWTGRILIITPHELGSYYKTELTKGEHWGIPLKCPVEEKHLQEWTGLYDLQELIQRFDSTEEEFFQLARIAREGVL
jgi:hypothetical protein